MFGATAEFDQYHLPLLDASLPPKPDVPELPFIPLEPALPDVPELPFTPLEPDEPLTPDEPLVPELPLPPPEDAVIPVTEITVPSLLYNSNVLVPEK